MNKSLTEIGTRKTPQGEAILGRPDMVENSAGGYVWAVDDWMRLRRWLILGSQGGTYYIGEQKLTKDNCDAALRLIQSNGPEVVKLVTEISTSGRAPRNDYSLFVLAMCASLGDIDTKQAAFAAVPKVARIGTHLMTLIKFAEQFRGWGRGFKGAVASWYGLKSPKDVVYQTLKYRSRGDWSQRDILRSCHPKPTSDVYDFVYRYITHGVSEPLFALPTEFAEALFGESADGLVLLGDVSSELTDEFRKNDVELAGKLKVGRVSSRPGYSPPQVNGEWLVKDYVEGKVRQSFCIKSDGSDLPINVYEGALTYSIEDTKRLVALYGEHNVDMIEGFELAKRATTVAEILRLIKKYNLPRECIPTQFLKSKGVWRALLTAGRGMPMTAMIRNLGNMGACGLLEQGAMDIIGHIRERLADQDILKRARVHPLAVLSALCTYSRGQGFRGSNEWPVVGDIVDALDSAFYLSFGNVTPTNQKICIGLDVSGSMAGGEVNGIPGMQPRMASCAMAMVTYRTEPNIAVMAFSHELVPVNMRRGEDLTSLMSRTAKIPFGRTNCALPMTWAMDMYKKNPDIVFDAFIIYTDNETWCGAVHPSQALQDYRRLTNRPAKLVTVGLTSNEFTIADPEDSGSMDFVGFDTAAPEMMSQFLRGEL